MEKYNNERHLSHIKNIELVQVDFMKTADTYLAAQQQTIVSLLYPDFDLYEPTMKALEVFLRRIPKGAIVEFDEVMGIRNHRVQRFPFDPWISYIEL